MRESAWQDFGCGRMEKKKKLKVVLKKEGNAAKVRAVGIVDEWRD